MSTLDDLSGTIVRKICMTCSREFSGTIGNCPHDGQQLHAIPQDAWIGKTLAGRYHIKKILGTGGMGVVYLAHHELMNTEVAIKMLRSQYVQDMTSVKRFQQEATLASKLKHPNIIVTHDYGVTPETHQPYMIIELLSDIVIDGQELKARSLSHEIKSKGNIPVERAVHIFKQACAGLSHAHRHGVIHRDVKPGNLMIVPSEDDPYFIKVVDFGVAKLQPINSVGGAEGLALTQTGEVCGSPVYMSPEQCTGQPLDPRADVYSMGVVLYEALTGKVPLLGKNMVDTMSKHINVKPSPFNEVRPDLYMPERLELVVMRALAKDPYQRQQSMAELAQELDMSIPRPGQSLTMRAPNLLEVPEEKPKNWMAPAAIAIMLAIVTCGICIAWFASRNHNTAPEAVAPEVTQSAPVGATATSSSGNGTHTTTPTGRVPATAVNAAAHTAALTNASDQNRTHVPASPPTQDSGVRTMTSILSQTARETTPHIEQSWAKLQSQRSYRDTETNSTDTPDPAQSDETRAVTPTRTNTSAATRRAPKKSTASTQLSKPKKKSAPIARFSKDQESKERWADLLKLRSY